MSSEAEDLARELATALMEGTVAMAPMFDVADGIRADMEKRGWSPTAAETVALQWLLGSISKMWSS